MIHDASENCAFCLRIAAPGSGAAEVVWEFPQSVVLLGAWQFFEGYCIAVSRRHVRELYELEVSARHAYIDEIAVLGQALVGVFKPRKLNVEMLGNQVPHLHCHVFPRYEHDPEHLKPAWVAIDRAEGNEAQRRRLEAAEISREELRTRIRKELTNRPS
jgi:diadenosine tetraphosphate (Ap4A) HIT family hydrolase